MISKKVTAICPGSCGEFIQGIVNGREISVSYPIDMYSSITVQYGNWENIRNSITPYKKLTSAVDIVLEHLGIPVNKKRNIEILRKSNLPMGKGMSSSTADIGSLAVALAAYFGYELKPHEIMAIATSIEPTDGIFYKDIVLYDIEQKSIAKTIGPVPALKVLVLEGEGLIDTVSFRNRRVRIPEIDAAYIELCHAIETNNWAALGRACIVSAMANQDILPKPRLEEIIATALEYGAYGVNVAHTGTAVGILMDENIDEYYLLKSLRNSGVLQLYGRYNIVHMITNRLSYFPNKF